nr:MAG TPA: Transcription factor TFIID complex subunit 8 C-term [Crassvirales sp.]
MSHSELKVTNFETLIHIPDWMPQALEINLIFKILV